MAARSSDARACEAAAHLAISRWVRSCRRQLVRLETSAAMAMEHRQAELIGRLEMPQQARRTRFVLKVDDLHHAGGLARRGEVGCRRFDADTQRRMRRSAHRCRSQALSAKLRAPSGLRSPGGDGESMRGRTVVATARYAIRSSRMNWPCTRDRVPKDVRADSDRAAGVSRFVRALALGDRARWTRGLEQLRAKG